MKEQLNKEKCIMGNLKLQLDPEGTCCDSKSSSLVNFSNRFPFVAVSIGFSVNKQVSDVVSALLGFESQTLVLRFPPGGVWCRLQLSRRQNVHSETGEGLFLQRRPAAGL